LIVDENGDEEDIDDSSFSFYWQKVCIEEKLMINS
jgi:hypothetical protein